MTSRAHTKEEMLEMMMQHLESQPDYWNNVKEYTTLEKLEGMLFSILVMFDGGTMVLPALDIVPHPHPSDKKYHIDEDENYWDEVVINDTSLHDLYCARKKKRKDK